MINLYRFKIFVAYRVFREELTTILSIEHERIIKYKGVSFKPFAMFFELAPKGSLSSFLDKFKERKKELPSHIVTQTLQQVFMLFFGLSQQKYGF